MSSKSLKLFSSSSVLQSLEEKALSRLWRRQHSWKVFRTIAQFSLDLTVFMAAFVLAYLLRFDFKIPKHELFNMAAQYPGVLAIQLATLYLLRGHKLIWRYISLEDVYRFMWTAFISSVPVVML